MAPLTFAEGRADLFLGREIAQHPGLQRGHRSPKSDHEVKRFHPRQLPARATHCFYGATDKALIHKWPRRFLARPRSSTRSGRSLAAGSARSTNAQPEIAARTGSVEEDEATATAKEPRRLSSPSF